MTWNQVRYRVLASMAAVLVGAGLIGRYFADLVTDPSVLSVAAIAVGVFINWRARRRLLYWLKVSHELQFPEIYGSRTIDDFG